MGRLDTNVLIIGKSGVGKSSLLNYLFRKEVQETAAGRAVTKEGIFAFSYPYDDKFTINIYDTWGLEPSKTEKWRNLIMDEVRQHERADIKEWFNSIIFCISAATARVEDFELDIIKSLLNEKNHLIVTITNCKSEADQTALVMKRTLIDNTTLTEHDIIFVNNVEKKLIGGCVKQFGREAVFTSIIRNLWITFKDKVPYRINQILDEEFEEESKKLHELASIRHFVFRKEKKLDEFEREVNYEFQNFVERIAYKINRRFNDAIDYYNALSKQYADIGELLDENDFKYNPKLKYVVFKKFKEELEVIVQGLKNKINEIHILKEAQISKEVLNQLGMALGTYFLSQKKIKKELNESIDKYLSMAKKYLKEEIEEINCKIQEKDIENLYANQLKTL